MIVMRNYGKLFLKSGREQIRNYWTKWSPLLVVSLLYLPVSTNIKVTLCPIYREKIKNSKKIFIYYTYNYKKKNLENSRSLKKKQI